MNSRDRVVAAVEFNKPDRCPIMHSVLPGALLKHGGRLVNLLRRYPQDFGPSDFHVPRVEDLAPDYRRGVGRDEWGVFWRSEVDGIKGQVYEPPLRNWDALHSYEFPRLPSGGDVERLRRHVDSMRDRGYFVILGFNPGNYFERMQWLRGFVNLMVDFVRKPKELYTLADMLLDYCLQSMDVVLQAKPDAISFGDDWGAQDRLLVNPSFFRSFFKPRYKRMFDLVHDDGAYLYFHSDGYIIDVIPDLHDIGVDILNPQFSCHDLKELAEATCGKICVSSDVDRQYILPRGSPSEVRDYVKKVIDLFGYGSNGGLICRGEVNIDVPMENIEAMYEAFLTYGEYHW